MLTAEITKHKMIAQLQKVIWLIEQDLAHVKLSMESEPMTVHVLKIDDPLPEPDRYTLTIEVERILK